MKTMTCRQMGGTCDAKLEASTSAEMAKKMTAHVMAEHPDVAAKMKNMSSEEHEKWESEFHRNWNRAPEAGGRKG